MLQDSLYGQVAPSRRLAVDERRDAVAMAAVAGTSRGTRFLGGACRSACQRNEGVAEAPGCQEAALGG